MYSQVVGEMYSQIVGKTCDQIMDEEKPTHNSKSPLCILLLS